MWPNLDPDWIWNSFWQRPALRELALQCDTVHAHSFMMEHLVIVGSSGYLDLYRSTMLCIQLVLKRVSHFGMLNSFFSFSGYDHASWNSNLQNMEVFSMRVILHFTLGFVSKEEIYDKCFHFPTSPLFCFQVSLVCLLLVFNFLVLILN